MDYVDQGQGQSMQRAQYGAALTLGRPQQDRLKQLSARCLGGRWWRKRAFEFPVLPDYLWARNGSLARALPLVALEDRAMDMWTMRWRAPARPVDNVSTRCPPPAPSPTCPQPSTAVDEQATNSGSNTLVRPTTDRLATRRRSEVGPGSYLHWKRLSCVRCKRRPPAAVNNSAPCAWRISRTCSSRLNCA